MLNLRTPVKFPLSKSHIHFSIFTMNLYIQADSETDSETSFKCKYIIYNNTRFG